MLATTFAALRDRRFAAMFVGQVLSNTGTWMERAALASLVYTLTGEDERWLALVAALPAIPAMLLSVPAGALVDRIDVRRLIVVTQSAMLVLAAGLAALASAGLVRPWHLAAYAFVSSAVFVVDAPARQSFVSRIVDRGDLTNALALTTVTFNVARLAGGAAFSLVFLRTDWAEPGCFWLNAASFLFPVAALAWIREDPRPDAGPSSHSRDVLEGLRHVARTPVLRAAVLLVLLVSLLGFQVSHLVPVFAEKVWDVGKPGQGALHGHLGFGALAGGLTLAFASRRVRRGRHVLRTAFLACALLVAAACSQSFSLACWFLSGSAFLLIQSHSGCNAILQSRVPDALRGRVVALYTMCILGAFPLGGLLAGHAAHAFGAPTTTIVSATVLAFAVVALALTHRDLVDEA